MILAHSHTHINVSLVKSTTSSEQNCSGAEENSLNTSSCPSSQADSTQCYNPDNVKPHLFTITHKSPWEAPTQHRSFKGEV